MTGHTVATKTHSGAESDHDLVTRIRGRVVDPGGGAAPFAKVEAFSYHAGPGNGLVGAGRSIGDGSFVVELSRPLDLQDDMPALRVTLSREGALDDGAHRRLDWDPTDQLSVEGDVLDVGSIRLFVRKNVTVRVTFAGNPVPGARLWLEWSGEISGLQRDDRWATTDGVGVVVTSVDATSMHVEVKKEGFTTVSERVELAGQDVEIEVPIEREAAISGRLVDSEGEPVGSLWVEARQPGPERLLNGVRREASRARVRAGRDGVFVLTGLAQSGHYVVKTEVEHTAGFILDEAKTEVDAPASNVALLVPRVRSARVRFTLDGQPLKAGGTPSLEWRDPATGSWKRPHGLAQEWQSDVYVMFPGEYRAVYWRDGTSYGTETVNVEGGSDVQQIDLKALPGRDVRGRVVDSHGVGRASWPIHLEWRGNRFDVGYAGGDGRFVVKGVPREVVHVVAGTKWSPPVGPEVDEAPTIVDPSD